MFTHQKNEGKEKTPNQESALTTENGVDVINDLTLSSATEIVTIFMRKEKELSLKILRRMKYLASQFKTLLAVTKCL